jgi:hypothetical protein
MPNHTTNQLTLEGPDDQLDIAYKLLTATHQADAGGDELGEDKLDFNCIVECPKILLRCVSPIRFGVNGRVMLSVPGDPYSIANIEANEEEHQQWLDAQDPTLNMPGWTRTEGGISWYEFCNIKWGTKWNAYDQSIERNPGQIVFRFCTAWDAPRAYYEAMLKKLRETVPNVTITAWARHEFDDKVEDIINGETV